MWRFTKIILFFWILQNLLFWPLDGMPRLWLIDALVWVPFILNAKRWTIPIKPIVGISAATILMVVWVAHLDGIITSIAQALALTTGIYLLVLRDAYKEDLLNTIVRWFGILTLLSLAAYLLWLIVGFNSFGVLQRPYGYNNHSNYLLFILPYGYAGVMRFSGPFIEPGHYSIACVFLMFASHFNFKRQPWLWALLAGAIFSLSLAGYILLAIGYAMWQGIGWRKIAGVCFLVGGFYWVAVYGWNNGDNPINEKIIERLQYDDEKGISGNNRNLYQTDRYFAKMVLDESIIEGIGGRKMIKMAEHNQIGGAGITVFLIMYGVVGLLLIIWYYCSVPIASRNKGYMWKFFLLICLCFLQRAYPMWMAWLLPYMLATRITASKVISHSLQTNIRKS